MDEKKIMPIAFLLLFLLAGCFPHRSEAIAKDSVAYVYFTGNLSGAVFMVEKDGKTIYHRTSAQTGVRYTLQPGVYRVVVDRWGTPAVERKLFFADGQAVEVRVP